MAKPGLKVSDTDKGWKDLHEQVIKLSGTSAYVQVGVQGAPAAANHNDKPGLTIGQIANVHEFGKTIQTKRATIVIPQRSFIRATIDKYEAAIQKRATMLGTGVLLVKFTTEQALELLGMYAVGLMQQTIANRIAPPNRPRTIARKGSSVPLIDSGQLRGSITHKIEQGA
jgi:hypothetical protein